MPANPFAVVCLLLSQSGPGLEFDPQPPPLRGGQFQRQTEPKAPGLRLGEPGLGKPKSSEPKTTIQPSTRRPPVTLELDDPVDEGRDFAPPAAPGAFKPRTSRPVAPATIEPPEEESFDPPPRRTDPVYRARVEPPAATRMPAKPTPLASSLLQHALHSTPGRGLSGEPVSLLTALDRTSDRATQLRIVKAYWLLAMGVAEHHYALNESEFLESLPAPRAAHEQAMFTASRAAATANLRQSELAAAATQQDLIEASASLGNSAQPLPADVPYVGSYRTAFKELFAGRVAPAALKRIDRTLPRLRDVLDAQAAAVSAADKSLYALSQAYEENETSLASVLEAQSQLRRQRREFLVAVRDYNFSIADYAMAVVSPNANRSAVVAMLIETSSKTKSVLVPSNRDVLPVSGEDEIAPGDRSVLRRSAGLDEPAFRAPVSDDLVPVAPPSLRSSEFIPGR